MLYGFKESSPYVLIHRERFISIGEPTRQACCAGACLVTCFAWQNQPPMMDSAVRNKLPDFCQHD